MPTQLRAVTALAIAVAVIPNGGIPPDAVDMPASLWVEPSGNVRRDPGAGPWGAAHAPAPDALYTLVHRKHSGVNPGMTVRDPSGREWSVKQSPPDGRPSEVQVEVVVSRILSALGYHQPPVYYLPSFVLADDWGTHREPAARFRLKARALKDRGTWSWNDNPFVGTRPYQGLLVVLMIVNSSDIKDANNTLYEHRTAAGSEHWYVVRDLGTALGSTGRFAPTKGDAEGFAREPLLDRAELGSQEPFVRFNYHGRHQGLVRDRITAADLRWAAERLARIDDRQWLEIFAAGGYSQEQAQPFIDVIAARVAESWDAARDRGLEEGS